MATSRPATEVIKNAYDQLFTSGITVSKIRDAVAGDRFFPVHEDASVFGVPGRSMLWKLFLLSNEPLSKSTSDNPVPPLDALRAARTQFRDLLVERMRSPDGKLEDGFIIPGTGTQSKPSNKAPTNLETNNPLSLHTENPWTAWFASLELRRTILQDVERTFPEIGYFRDANVQYQLTNILFLYSSTHPETGYRQGMHEVLAPIYYAVDFDSLSSGADIIPADHEARELCSRDWVAADSWALFENVMMGIGKWYEWREDPSSPRLSLPHHVNLHEGPVTLKQYVAPVVQECDRIHSTLLRTIDPLLYQSMQTAGIEPQIYGIRWLRLMFTREFTMPDAMALWDGIFTCDTTYEIMPWICIAMLLRIRNDLIPSDYTGQITSLLRYPSQPSPETPTSALMLLRQAVELQLSPTPSTGAAVVMENHNLLNIPIDIPQPQPSSSRGRQKQENRARPGAIPELSHSRSSMPGPSGHSRQRSFQAAALPEMFAKGLMERGESLGINKTLINAVSELRRNLPDIAASLRSPPLESESYTAFPLTSERVQFQDERPSREPRTRFDMEHDLQRMRVRNRQLGKSVAWIVDVLLQDEEGSDADALKAVRERKREALEVLSYVRDSMLDESLQDIDESRLYAEEELRKRRLKPDNQVPDLRMLSTPIPATTVDSQPKFRPMISHQTALSQSTTPTSTPSPAMSPGSEAVGLAPWAHTRSTFSGSPLPSTSLPRPPPPTSTSFRPNGPIPRSNAPRRSFQSISPPEPVNKGSHTSSLQDPLGVLH